MAKQKTDFLPAERTDNALLDIQAKDMSNIKNLKEISKAIPDVFMILNQERQIVFSNQAMFDFLNVKDEKEVCGLRPGEAFSCEKAFIDKGGCGTTEFCRTCGAAQAIVNSMKGKADVQECRIIRKENGDPLDLRVWTTPFKHEGNDYTIFSIKDISNEKRRRVLERLFFHDIINTAGGLKGFASLLKDFPEDVAEYKDIIFMLSEKIIDEIQMQKLISSAENGDLVLSLLTVNTKMLLSELEDTYRKHEVADGKYIHLDRSTADVSFESDPTLLRRVLGNMIKNALEASEYGDTVTIKADNTDGAVLFSVNNPAVMPRNVQLQVFQRSFSTKGGDRGLGTYSMKLLGEKFLKGKVWFDTEEGKGTTFYLHLDI